MNFKLRIGFIFFLVSFIALLTQVIYLRQVLLLFEQSEYIISIFLFFWLGANGLGVFIGNRKTYPKQKIFTLTQLYAVVAIGFYYVLILTRPELLGIKTTGNLTRGIIYTLLSITIISGFNGWLFAQFAKLENDGKNIIRLYKIETLAFVIAGILSSIIIFYYPAFLILAGAVMALQLAILKENAPWGSFALSAIALVLIIIAPSVRSGGLEPLFPGYAYVETKSAPSGEVNLLTDTANADTMLLFQGAPAITAKPPAAHEEATFPALAQGFCNPKILISGSDIIPILNGLSKSKFRKINILIKDSRYFAILKTHFPSYIRQMLQQSNVQVIHETIQKHLSKQKNKYDIIYINEPRPALMENALIYFPDNISTLRSGLNSGGCLSLLFQSEAAYSGRINKNLKGSILKTTSDIFKHTGILALDTYTVILASENPLSTEFSEMEQTLERNGIYANYFNSFNVGTRLMNQKSIGMDEIDKYKTSLSFDKPLVYLAGLLQMFQKYAVNLTNQIMAFGERVYRNMRIWQLLVLTSLLVVFIMFALQKPGYAVVFNGGFAGIAAQTMFIYFYQLYFGNIYLLIGLLISLFMLGLLGGLMLKNPNHKKWLSTTSILLISGFLFLLTIGACLFAIYAGILLSGLYTGLLFNSVNQHKKIPGLHLYINDLLGAMAGNILIPVLIIPFLGFYVPILLMAFMGIVTQWLLYRNY